MPHLIGERERETEGTKSHSVRNFLISPEIRGEFSWGLWRQKLDTLEAEELISPKKRADTQETHPALVCVFFKSCKSRLICSLQRKFSIRIRENERVSFFGFSPYFSIFSSSPNLLFQESEGNLSELVSLTLFPFEKLNAPICWKCFKRV